MKKQDYLDWQSFFVAVAKICAMRSKDPATQVGAVLVNPLKQIIATGYNGFPRGIHDDVFPWNKTAQRPWLDTKYPYVAHAELNAIVSARTNLTDCDLYVTLFPCNECAKIIIQAGIHRIFYISDKNAHLDTTIAAKKMLTAVGIAFSQVGDLEVQVIK